MHVERSSALPKNGREAGLETAYGQHDPSVASRCPKTGQRQQSRAPGEAELVARAKSGDRQAFDPLYRAYSKVMFGYALKLTRGDWATAQDAAADAWLAAMNNIDSYEDRGNGLGSWLSTIVYFRAASIFRVRSVERSSGDMHSGDLAAAAVAELEPDEDPADAVAEARHEERVARLYEAVAALSPRQRQVAQMRLSGMRECEVAARVGLSVKAVGANWASARRNLADRMTNPPRLTAGQAARQAFQRTLRQVVAEGHRQVSVADMVARYRERDPSWVSRQMAELAASGYAVAPGLSLRRTERPGRYEVRSTCRRQPRSVVGRRLAEAQDVELPTAA
jgi:RNA polymerase sigma-70 factor (ECF subfamily)